MSKLALCLAAASSLALGGAAFAQSTSTTTSRAPATPPASTTTQPSTTPATPPVTRDPAMSAQAGTPQSPATPPATTTAPVNPATPGQTAQAPAPAAGATSVASGMTLKDNTGAAIGTITELKPDASGQQMATVKMGEDSFTVAASSLAVQNGAAVINLSQAQLQAMVHKPKS